MFDAYSPPLEDWTFDAESPPLEDSTFISFFFDLTGRFFGRRLG
jgi:hypothetical protein